MYNNFVYNLVTKRININPFTVPQWHAGLINTTNNDVIIQQKKIIEYIQPLVIYSGQYPHLKKAKKSVSAFNIRKSQLLGTTSTMHKKRLHNFLTVFKFSLLPKIQKWETKKQIKSNYLGVYCIGLEELRLWPFGIKTGNSGALVQLIIKHNKNTDLLDFFLSYYSIKNKKAYSNWRWYCLNNQGSSNCQKLNTRLVFSFLFL